MELREFYRMHAVSQQSKPYQADSQSETQPPDDRLGAGSSGSSASSGVTNSGCSACSLPGCPERQTGMTDREIAGNIDIGSTDIGSTGSGRTGSGRTGAFTAGPLQGWAFAATSFATFLFPVIAAICGALWGSAVWGSGTLGSGTLGVGSHVGELAGATFGLLLGMAGTMMVSRILGPPNEKHSCGITSQEHS
jgi:hypothetical protein